MNINLDLLDEDSAKEAIHTVAKIAKNINAKWALVGGLAMAIYGSDRVTKDIDIISDKLLPLKKQSLLRQGGERYLVKTRKKEVAVDWILRNDEFEQLFLTALTEATIIDEVPILTPEWLVILKFIAGRFKDQEDAIYLLSKKDLVNRNLIKEHIIRVVGRVAWGLAKHGYQRWYDIADGRSKEESENENNGYIDS